MNCKSIYRKFRLSSVTAAMLAAFAGCAYVHDEYPDYSTEGDFNMSLKVIAGSAESRAVRDDDYEEDGIEAENYIDFAGRDFSIVIFDKNGNYIYQLETDPGQWVSLPLSTGYTGYFWEGPFVLPEETDKSVLDNIRDNGYQVMVVANWHAVDRSTVNRYNFSKPGNGYQTLQEILTDNSGHNYVYAPVTAGASVKSSWRPDKNSAAKRLIPMFGMADATKFEKRTNGKFYSMATVPLQRAMSKIEIVDQIEEELSISDAYLTGYNTSGRYIPEIDENTNSSWSDIGTQVTTSSLPASVTKDSGLHFFKEEGSTAKWVAYVPEMELGDADFDSNGQDNSRTHIEVSVTDGSQTSQYQLHFAKYNQVSGQASRPTIPDDTWKHLLRNHIYRFYVNHVHQGPSLDLHLHVIPWYLDDEEVWNYTDNVTIGKTLTWSDGTYDGEISDEDGSEQGFVNLHFDNDNAKFLTGTFRITSPVNGKWHARLIPLDDAKTDAMTFIDENGDVLEPNTGGDNPVCLEMSGDIKEGSGDVTIRIRPTVFDNDMESRFRLEFSVENLGKWYKVSMTGKAYDCYTIVRRPNIIQP